MKKIIYTLFISIMCINYFNAQTIPQGIKYQAVARDASGTEISNQVISLKMSLHGELKTSKVYYIETHDITTNEFGLFSLCIGEGNVQKGNFDKIPWSQDNIWIEIALKEQGDNKFTTLSNSKLLAVPYAYHANTANQVSDNGNGNVNGNGPLNGVPSQNWSLFGNSKSDPEKDKLGTTDPADLVFVTDNIERMRLLNTGELEVRENAQFDKNINVDNITKTDYLVVADEANDTIPDPYPRYESIADIRGLLVADSIAIRGGLDIGGNLKVHGDSVIVDHHLLVGERTFLKGQVTINTKPALTGGDSDYDAYPLRIEGSNQGVAIKVNTGTPNNSNNFITFFNGSGSAVGRIEGETASEVASTPEYIFETTILGAEIIAAGVNIGLSALPNACAGLGVVACPPEPSVVAIAIAEEVLAIANEAAYQIFAYSDVGVTYQSGSADYAEWLERLNYSEKLFPGDIVSVIGGKVTKNTNRANQYLIVSTNPAVLGNMPSKVDQDRFEKIAFMGQVPVKVRGKVSIGDYIIPSGLHDGTGIAISPKLINSNQYAKIIGIAWADSPKDRFISFVNISIGLNNNDVAKLVVEQQGRIETLEKSFNAMEKRFALLESGNIKPTTESVIDDIDIIDIPDELDVSLINDAILLLKDGYREKGIDVDTHPGLKKLFNDETFRLEVIEKVKENFEIGRRNILKMRE